MFFELLDKLLLTQAAIPFVKALIYKFLSLVKVAILFKLNKTLHQISMFDFFDSHVNDINDSTWIVHLVVKLFSCDDHIVI